MMGKLDICKLLIEKGANTKLKNDKDRTPLDCAEYMNEAETAQYLKSLEGAQAADAPKEAEGPAVPQKADEAATEEAVPAAPVDAAEAATEEAVAAPAAPEEATEAQGAETAPETAADTEATPAAPAEAPAEDPLCKARFNKQLVYTWVSRILLAVNPFQVLPLYASQVLDQYRFAPELRATASMPMLKSLELEAPECYAYTRAGQLTVPGLDDLLAFDELKEALDSLGIHQSTQVQMWKNLAAAAF
eukprot:g10942.t1